MFRSLRNQLILSHVLPLLIVVPVMGIALVYTLETRFFIPSLSSNLVDDARLIATVAGSYPDLWANPELAQNFFQRLSAGQAERIWLITASGGLQASSSPSDRQQDEQWIDQADLEMLNGRVLSRIVYSQSLDGQVIDVLVPVFDSGNQVVGIVRLTYRYDSFYQEFLRLRYLTGGILLASLLVGVLLGLGLALNIGQPVEQVTQAVQDLSSGKQSQLLPEKGPEEVRSLLRAVNNLVRQLNLLEESRRKLLANLVHELGRPLGALRAAIQALRRGAKEDPALLDELLQGMDAEAMQLQRLTEDLAELHDQVLGSLELEYKEFRLGEWLRPMLSAWGEAALEQHLEWKTDIPEDLPVVRADPNRLAQAVGNLTSNAIKYTPPGGQVRVSAGADGREAWIKVSDTGQGIPVEEQAKLFQPFARGQQGKRFPQGMGLGLNIARDLVEAHGGRIEVETAPGEGSTFTIYVPLSASNS